MAKKLKFFAVGLLIGALYYVFAIIETQVHQNFYTDYSRTNIIIDIIVLLLFPLGLLFLLWNKYRAFFYWILAGIPLGLLAIAITTYAFAGPKYPVKEDTLAKLERYKNTQRHYPPSLDIVGVKYEKEWTRYDPSTDGTAFSLCYVTPMMHEGSEIIITKPTYKRIVDHHRYPVDVFECYDSKTGKWESKEYARKKR